MKSCKRVKRSSRGQLFKGQRGQVKRHLGDIGVIGGTSDSLKVRDYPENRSAWASRPSMGHRGYGVSGFIRGLWRSIKRQVKEIPDFRAQSPIEQSSKRSARGYREHRS